MSIVSAQHRMAGQSTPPIAPPTHRSWRQVCRTLAYCAVLVWLATAGAVSAQDRPGRRGGDEQSRGEPGGSVLRLLPADAVSKHTVELGNGRTLSYTATAGTLPDSDKASSANARSDAE